MPGSIGVAHTRWATHGAPSAVNAHPHMDCHGKVAVVHNGVIENFLPLKKELLDKGHHIVSKTDTELVAHLIEENLRRDKSLREAFVEAANRLVGSYALAVISTLEPETLLLARNEAPLVIGVGDRFMYAASDVTAFLEMTNRAVFLQDGEAAFLTREGYRILKLASGDQVARNPVILPWTVDMAEKHGYPHYMLKEIHEQRETLRNALRLQHVYVDLVAELLDRGSAIFLLGAGTSYHACLAGSYLLSKLARISAYPVIASEFEENYGGSLGAESVILAVSQSGETADVLNALEFSRLRAATILGITNTVGSTLTRVSRAYLLQNAGPEIGVAATKTFTSQIIVLAQLALRLARRRGKLAQFEMDELEDKLCHVPDIVGSVTETVGPVMRGVAEKVADAKTLFFLGRGISSSVCLEARLKVMELSYIPSIAYPAGESKHGPISVVEEGLPVFFVVPNDNVRRQSLGSIMEMKARGAVIISVGDEGDDETREVSDHFIGMPQIDPLLSPVVYVIPFQFLAYHLALVKGHNPDRPRNLAKSVTVL